MTTGRFRSGMTLLFTGYSLLLMYWMFIGFGRAKFPSTELRYNLVPFTTIKMYLLHYHNFSFRTWAINLFGNVAVFVPFGIFLPALFKLGQRLSSFLILFLGPLLLLEILQTLLRLGSFDVDDLILNLFGALIGFVCCKVMYKFTTHSSS